MVANDRKPSTQTVYNPRLRIFKQISPSPPQKKNWYEEQHIAPTDAFLREVTFFHVPLFNQVKQTAEYYLLQVSNFYSLSK